MNSPVFHPDLRTAARWLPRGVGRPWLVKLARLMPMPSVPMPAGITVREVQLDANQPLRGRVIGAPPDGSARPVMLWIHGGGYVIGTAKQDDGLCARFARRLGMTVVSVDYRLAPEHPFPAPLDDCFAAYEFIHREAASLGVDPSRLVIGGQSAGGGLAAALTLLVHDRKRPAPRLQLLVYPMLDDRTVERAIDGRAHRLWDQQSNRYGWTSYLAQAPGSPGITDLAAPARRVDFSGLPPAWIGVGSCDLFHDEDLAYAAALRDAGVTTTLEIVEGAFHGFDAALPKAAVSRRFFESYVAAIEKALDLR